MCIRDRVDDSIVRGTTCRRMIDLLRRAGVREIHMRVSAPPFVSPCYYGTDIDSAEDLIATRHTVEEIARIIGVDSLGYLSLEHTGQLAGAGAEGFCTACFGGGYPTACLLYTSGCGRRKSGAYPICAQRRTAYPASWRRKT